MIETRDERRAARTLLLVTYNFPPSAASGSYRLLGFVRHLPGQGWKTVVVAPRTTPFEPVDEDLARRVPADTVHVEVPFRWTKATWPLRGMYPVACYRFDVLRWMKRATRAAARAVAGRPIDAILTSGPPHEAHVAGLRLKRRFGLPWVADFRDPWVANSWMDMNSRGLPRSWSARMERAVVTAADLVVTNAPAACASLQAAFPEHAGKIVSLTNGYDPEAFADIQRQPDPSGRWTLAHPGELYAGRDPRPLFEALRGLLRDWPADQPSPQLRLLGGGKSLNSGFIEELRRLELQDIVTHEGHVPHRQALQAMVNADVLVLLDSVGRKAGVPAKLYEFLGAGRPVLALAEPDGDTASVLRTSGVEHRIARPNDAPAIEQALRELAAVRSTTGAPAEGRLQFTRERLTAQLAAMIDRLMTADAARRPVAAGDRLPAR